MAPLHRLAKRCASLEQWAKEQRRPLEWAQQFREQWKRSILALFAVFPESRYDDLLGLIQSDAWQKSGLEFVRHLIAGGYWQPVTIPPAVAAIFLAEPDVRPDARCQSCKTVLPLRMGIWTNTSTGQYWQAPLCYFRRCPCGGAILYAGGRPVDIGSWLPERVVPPWTFVDERVRWQQEREREQAARGVS